jgi:hypothetical protein
MGGTTTLNGADTRDPAQGWRNIAGQDRLQPVTRNAEVHMHRAALAVIVGLALATVPLRAQGPVRVGVAAGLTTGQGRGAGWHAQASAEAALPVERLGLRADFSYHSVRRGEMANALEVPSVALGVTLALPRLGPVAPYAVGGPGWYRDDLGSGAEWHFGVHAGAGLALCVGRAELFGEVRAHVIKDGVDTRLVPLSLGLRF